MEEQKNAKKKDCFQIAVIILSIIWVVSFIGACFGLAYAIIAFYDLANIPNAGGTKAVIFSAIFLVIILLVVYAFVIFCVHTIGENRRNIRKLVT